MSTGTSTWWSFEDLGLSEGEASQIRAKTEERLKASGEGSWMIRPGSRKRGSQVLSLLKPGGVIEHREFPADAQDPARVNQLAAFNAGKHAEREKQLAPSRLYDNIDVKGRVQAGPVGFDEPPGDDHVFVDSKGILRVTLRPHPSHDPIYDEPSDCLGHGRLLFELPASG